MSYYSYTSSRESKPLPLNFLPGPIDVICDRGSESMNHVGNQRFRQILTESLVLYSNAHVKAEKSVIIVDIIRRIQRQSGRFVKKDLLTGTYFEVGDTVSRGKASHLFRQMMGKNKMKKSTKSCFENERMQASTLHDSVTASSRITYLPDLPLLISDNFYMKSSNSHYNVRESMSLSLLQNRDDGATLTSTLLSNSALFPQFIQQRNQHLINTNPSNYIRESSSVIHDDVGNLNDFTCLCQDIDAAIASFQCPLLNQDHSLDLSHSSFSSMD